MGIFWIIIGTLALLVLALLLLQLQVRRLERAQYATNSVLTDYLTQQQPVLQWATAQMVQAENPPPAPWLQQVAIWRASVELVAQKEEVFTLWDSYLDILLSKEAFLINDDGKLGGHAEPVRIQGLAEVVHNFMIKHFYPNVDLNAVLPVCLTLAHDYVANYAAPQYLSLIDLKTE